MRVLFVYTVSNAPPPPRKPILEWIEISFAVSYLAAALRAAGHQVELLVLRHGNFKRQLEGELARFEPELVCHTAVATEFPLIQKIAAHIRTTRPELYQAIGGSHVTLRPDDALTGAFDAICLGEGEEALVELAGALARGERPAGIQNFWFTRGGALEKNPTRPFRQDIDAIPFPVRDIWRRWIEQPPKHTLLIARGCPFTCTYCSNHALWQVQSGKYVRFRSIENVLAELELLCAEFPEVTYCYFEVETISADKPWALDFARALEAFNRSRARALIFAINLRVHPGAQFAELFEALARGGFSYLRIGIETGSERVRRDVLHRNESNADLIRTFDDAKRSGLEVYAYNLIGLPGETPADFLQTIELNRHPNVTRSYLSIFYPYPGTELERVCAERKIAVPPLEDSAERFRARLGLPEFPDAQVEHYFRRFEALVAGERMPLFNRIDSIVHQTLRGYPRLERIVQRLRGHGVITRVRRAARSIRAAFSL